MAEPPPDPERLIATLPCWRGAPRIEPLAGGLTNRNFAVSDGAGRYVVRLGEDIPVHGVVRQRELAASRAAHAAGLSPQVIHAQQGVMVLAFIDGRALTTEDLRDGARLPEAIGLIKRCHRDMPRHLQQPPWRFDVFAVIRSYAGTLREGHSAHGEKLGKLLEKAVLLEQAAGNAALAFGHNDLLPANFLDDGRRLWLIDWEYAGFNSPLFDLGGLASNCEFSPAREAEMLGLYFGTVEPALVRRYEAMKIASLLRETLWSMVSEIHSTIDFDYAGYTRDNLVRFERAWQALGLGR